MGIRFLMHWLGCFFLPFALSALIAVNVQAREQQLLGLLEAARDGDAAAALEGSDLASLAAAERIGAGPFGPVEAVLAAEALKRRGQDEQAFAVHRAFVDHGLSGGTGSAQAVSALLPFVLWRAAEFVDRAQRPQADADWLLQAVDRIVFGDRRQVQARLSRRFSRFAQFQSLPQIRAQTLLHAIAVMQRVGPADRIKRYADFYVNAAPSVAGGLPPVVEAVFDDLVARGVVARDRLSLRLAGRMIRDLEFAGASKVLRSVLDDPRVDAESQSDALFLQARLQRLRGEPEEQQKATLDLLIGMRPEPDARKREQALGKRALILKRMNRRREMQNDFREIIDRYPRGRNADDALIELARDAQLNGEFDAALEWLERLEEHPGPNNWRQTTQLHTAFTHYLKYRQSRAAGDLEAALNALEALHRQKPKGRMDLVRRFWKARLLIDAGRSEEAAGELEQLIERDPFGYYGIRALAHRQALESPNPGAAVQAVRRQVIPDLAALRDKVGAALRQPPPRLDPAASPYHGRLDRYVTSGLQEAVAESLADLEAHLPGRLFSQFPLADLDEAGILIVMALDVASRLELFEARRRGGGEANLLSLAAFASDRLQQPGTALSMIVGSGGTIKFETGFLATAYPAPPFEAVRGAVARVGALVEIDDPSGLSALAYAIARRESLFVASSRSSMGALGLMQVTLPTLRDLDNGFGILKGVDPDALQAQLFTPEENLLAGTLHLAARALPPFQGNPMKSVMSYNIGTDVVRHWSEGWSAMGIEDDIELSLELARSTATRNYTRSVLADLYLMLARAP